MHVMKNLFFTLMIFFIAFKVNAQSKTTAQSWNLSGNLNIAPGTNYLGTADSNDLVVRTNAIERGRLFASGKWRFGTTSDNVQLNNGILTFSGKGVYQLDGNKYVFQYSANKNYGLFFNSNKPQYELRDGNAAPVFYVNADNGNGMFKGILKIGAYTLPSTDGTANEILKTDGAGVLSWKKDNNTTYIAGNGISISGNTINSTIKETQWTTSGNKIYYTKGNVGVGVSSPAYKLDVKGDINLDSGNVLRMEGKRMFQYNPYTFSLAIGDTSNMTAFGNTSIGLNALQSNTTGNDNTAVGESSLYKNTTGSQNTALGVALVGNISGSHNTAAGNNVLINNNSGSYNTASGFYTMYYNNTGSNNTAIGNIASYENTTGVYNTSEGDAALYGNESGNDNVGIGASALYNTTASDLNTAVGYYAGSTYDNGYNNVFIGAFTDVTGIGYYNDIAIGLGATCTDVSQVTIGNGATATYRAYANWSNISDGRFKKNIKQNVPGLSFINKLKPITYTLDATGIDNFLHKDLLQNKQPAEKEKAVINKALTEKEKVVYTGFVAQDVEKAAKELKYDFSGVDAAKNSKDLYGLRYAEFVVPLVKAVQELSTENEKLKNQTDEQQKINQDLQSRLTKLEAMMNVNQSMTSGQQSTVISAALQQNIPNPFSNTTTINYTLPQTYSFAKIIITNKNGSTLKQVNLTAKGKGSVKIDASTLSSGAYQYSLYVDGRLIDAKQMILTK